VSREEPTHRSLFPERFRQLRIVTNRVTFSSSYSRSLAQKVWLGDAVFVPGAAHAGFACAGLDLTATAVRMPSPTAHESQVAFFLDKLLLLVYSNRWVLLRTLPVTPASCWRFCFQASVIRPKPFIRNTYKPCTILVQTRPIKSFRMNTSVNL